LQQIGARRRIARTAMVTKALLAFPAGRPGESGEFVHFHF
jgi:hypothetical protein